MSRYEEGMVAWKADGPVGWRNYRAWQLHVNQGWRDAELLAHTDSAFLFEYEMPSGKCYLHEVEIGRDGMFRPIGKSINRARLSVKWRLAEWFVDLI